MIKSLHIGVIFTLINVGCSWAQLDSNNSSVKFENKDDDLDDPTGLKAPAIKLPNLTLPKDPLDPLSSSKIEDKKEDPLDITKGDGLLDYTTNTAPRYFTKDKEAKGEYGKDQNLGTLSTKSQIVNVRYRDHEYVDGDRIRVFVNDDVVQSNIYLNGTFQGFKLPLQKGFNRVEFQALNQGSSGPNTAELHIYDDNGILVSAKEWNLLTGNKATIVIVKD